MSTVFALLALLPGFDPILRHTHTHILQLWVCLVLLVFDWGFDAGCLIPSLWLLCGFSSSLSCTHSSQLTSNVLLKGNWASVFLLLQSTVMSNWAEKKGHTLQTGVAHALRCGVEYHHLTRKSLISPSFCHVSVRHIAWLSLLLLELNLVSLCNVQLFHVSF